MYNERKDKLSIWSYLTYSIIIFIIILIVVVIIVKSGGKKKKTEKPKEMVLYSLEELANIEDKYGKSMASNMATFKYTAIDYYKDKLGNEKVDMILTLQDFYDKHFIEELKVDETKCDSEKSKVEVTKKSGEYRLDFTLSCTDTATLTTYLGKYSYCRDSSICEKKVEKKKSENPTTVEPPVTPDPNPNPNPDPNPNPNPDPNPNPVTPSKYNFYEYTLTPSEKVGSYSEWSDWSVNEIQPSLMLEVDTKEETITKTEGCTETREETYIAGYTTETYIIGYENKKYKVGTRPEQVGTRQVTKNGKVVNEPIIREVPIYQTKETPIYGTRNNPIYKTRQVTVDNCTSSIKYYRSRSFKYNKGVNYIKYSTNENDNYLLSRGYTKTGNTKEF